MSLLSFLKTHRITLLAFLLLIIGAGWSIAAGERLPTVGGDKDNWGTILNNFLSKEHNTDGTHKTDTLESISGVINVKEYGAKGDWVTDDTAAIQAAINAAPSGSGQGLEGAIVHFPPGKYKVGSTLTLRAGIKIQGSGRQTTQIEFSAGGSSNLFTVGADPDWFAVRDIGLNSTGNTTGWAISSPLGVNRSVIIENVEVSGFLKGFQINGAINIHIAQSRLNGRGKDTAGGIGIELKTDTSGRGSNGAIIDSTLLGHYALGADVQGTAISFISPILESNGTAVRNAGALAVIHPWVTESAASKNDLDFDLLTPATLIGYGSSSWKIQYANDTIRNRTIIIPQSNDRASNDPNNIGGPAGIKLGKILIEDTGRINFFEGTKNNLGLWATDPVGMLRLENPLGPVISMNRSGFPAVFQIDTSGSDGAVYTTTAHPLLFRTNNVEAMRITSGGNIGIGATNPNAKLQVEGGNIYTSTAGNGLILKSPDGNTCQKVTIPNGGGNLVFTTVTCL